MSKYQIGDELRIREWDDMEAEFGVDSINYIDCRYGFVSKMKPLCGKDFTVSRIDGHYYFSEEGFEDGWDISSDMLKPRKEEVLYIASDKEFNKLLGIF